MAYAMCFMIINLYLLLILELRVATSLILCFLIRNYRLLCVLINLQQGMRWTYELVLRSNTAILLLYLYDYDFVPTTSLGEATELCPVLLCVATKLTSYTAKFYTKTPTRVIYNQNHQKKFLTQCYTRSRFLINHKLFVPC